MEHTDPETHHHGFLSLITAGAKETVPNGVPYGALALGSLDTPEVKAWVEQNKQYSIFIMAGSHFEMKGVPALTVSSSYEDYEAVIKSMPL
jgi:thioesterase domain-containing protein